MATANFTDPTPQENHALQNADSAAQRPLTDADVTRLTAGLMGDEHGDLVPGPRTPASDGDGVSPEHGAIYDCTGRIFNTCSFAGLDLLTSEQIRPLLARARKLEDDLDAAIEAAEAGTTGQPPACDDDGPVPDPLPLPDTPLGEAIGDLGVALAGVASALLAADLRISPRQADLVVDIGARLGQIVGLIGAAGGAQ